MKLPGYKPILVFLLVLSAFATACTNSYYGYRWKVEKRLYRPGWHINDAGTHESAELTEKDECSEETKHSEIPHQSRGLKLHANSSNEMSPAYEVRKTKKPAKTESTKPQKKWSRTIAPVIEECPQAASSARICHNTGTLSTFPVPVPPLVFFSLAEFCFYAGLISLLVAIVAVLVISKAPILFYTLAVTSGIFGLVSLFFLLMSIIKLILWGADLDFFSYMFFGFIFTALVAGLFYLSYSLLTSE